MIQSLLIVSFLVFGTALAGAEEVCPWINTATASGILGGEAVLKMDRAPSNPDDGVCTFTKTESDSTETLRIEVRTAAHPVTELAGFRKHCKGPVMDVKGIGNEAFACRIDREEELVSRVRNRVFTIRSTAGIESVPADTLIERVQAAAAQVAGSLF